MKGRTKGLLAAAVVAAVLAAAFWYGGGAPGLQGWNPAPAETAPVSPEPSAPGESVPGEGPAPAETAEEPPRETPEETQTAPAATPVPAETGGEAPAPSGTPAPAPPTESVPPAEEPEELTCTLTVLCGNALNHPDWLAPGVAEVLPAGGTLLPETETVFQEGETAFDLLLRLTRAAGIPVEYSVTPLYGTAYIEGIGNLYEFDCGQSSGWVYQVNGAFPGHSSSEHVLRDGDRVLFAYTCVEGDVPEGTP